MSLFIAVQRAGLIGGAPFSRRLEGRDLRTVVLVLKIECMLVFMLLLLLVEGLEVFAALVFDVVVVPRGIGMIHWLTVVWRSTRDVEHLDGVSGVGGGII